MHTKEKRFKKIDSFVLWPCVVIRGVRFGVFIIEVGWLFWTAKLLDIRKRRKLPIKTR